MSESMALVGLDVHQAQTVAAVLDRMTGELDVKRLRGAPADVVPAFLERLERPVRAVYEAGPTGFGLARAATARGLDLRVIAPGSIPRSPGDRVKTDRRDAKRLVRLLAAGELSFSFVPSEADERFRDLVRCIDDARRDLMRARHRLSKFLLRRGLRFGARQWTQPHLRWLGRLTFDDALSQAVFVDYLCAVEALVQRRRALIGVLEEAVPESSHAEAIARLRCFRGIDTLSAAGLCAEVGSFERFSKPALMSGFLGVVPSEYTSDQKRVQGSITKAGPTHARRLLVEAAHHYRRRPAVGGGLASRQAGQDPRVVQIAWRAQRRLHARWTHLGERRGKPTGTVAIACARELAAFCWEAATLD
ncbi:MAG: IS110 family transposase [Actinobacteria bacterium]|nr:IS110 family transposase [Actinomycetota bacterium]